MNNYILINRTFAEITPESSEIGDFSDNGLICENEPVTFRELCDLMKNHYQASQCPNYGGVDVWLSTGFFTADYSTGTEREECIHFSRDNSDNAAKYWRLAMKFAGIIK